MKSIPYSNSGRLGDDISKRLMVYEVTDEETNIIQRSDGTNEKVTAD